LQALSSYNNDNLKPLAITWIARKMSVTIFDIAKKANVSYATASRVLNGDNYGKRSDSLRRAKQILDIAKAEGYQPNSAAQILAGKRSRNICLLVSDNVQSGWGNAYLAQILEGVETACNELDYGLVLNNYRNDDFESFFMRRKLGGRGFDGIILARYVTSQMSEILRHNNIPFISINNHLENKDHIPACYSNGSEIEIIDYAYAYGHRKIGFIYDGRYPDMEKLNKYVQENGMNDCEVIPLTILPPVNFDSATALMDKYLTLSEAARPTIIAGNYQVCGAFLKEMYKHELKCPDDISLISTCDSELCMVVNPELTVISPDNRKIGENATIKLIDFLEKEIPIGYEPCTCKNIIVERKSVRYLCCDSK